MKLVIWVTLKSAVTGSLISNTISHSLCQVFDQTHNLQDKDTHKFHFIGKITMHQGNGRKRELKKLKIGTMVSYKLNKKLKK